MALSSRLNPVSNRCPQAPARSEAQCQLRSCSVGASFLIHHEACPPRRGTKTQRTNTPKPSGLSGLVVKKRKSQNAERSTQNKPGLLTRRWCGSFHRPDCSINGPDVSTKKRELATESTEATENE
jgi:hypothetical protein